MIQPGTYSTIGYKMACLLDETPTPDATTKRRWFQDIIAAYHGIPASEEFLRRDVQAEICHAFSLTPQQFVQMAGNAPHARPVAPQQPKPAPLDQHTAIEVELVRRALDSQAERDWWTTRQKLLGLWQDEAMQMLMYFVTGCESDAEVTELAGGGFFGTFAGLADHLIALHFAVPLPETTPYLVAKHHNLTLATRTAQLARQYAAGRNPDDLTALQGLKPINPEDWK